MRKVVVLVSLLITGVFVAPASSAWAVAPTVASIAPQAGEVGFEVVITGTDFTGTTAVAFDGTNSSFIEDSDVQITTTVPAGATTGPIAVTNADGTTLSSQDFTILEIVEAPVVEGFDPPAGSVGDEVAITGQRFTDATDVLFDGVGADFTEVSDSEIVAAIPQGAGTGPIVVIGPGGAGQSAQDFEVIDQLRLTDVRWSLTKFFPLVRDGYRETTRISWNQSLFASVRIQIRRQTSGTLVRTASMGGRRGSNGWTWNGQGSDGKVVAVGSYFALIRARSAHPPQTALRRSERTRVATALVTHKKSYHREFKPPRFYDRAATAASLSSSCSPFRLTAGFLCSGFGTGVAWFAVPPIHRGAEIQSNFDGSVRYTVRWWRGEGRPVTRAFAGRNRDHSILYAGVSFKGKGSLRVKSWEIDHTETWKVRI